MCMDYGSNYVTVRDLSSAAKHVEDVWGRLAAPPLIMDFSTVL